MLRSARFGGGSVSSPPRLKTSNRAALPYLAEAHTSGPGPSPPNRLPPPEPVMMDTYCTPSCMKDTGEARIEL